MAALTAHVAVLKGKGLKGAIAEALEDAAGLGGQERRFVAFAARELSRHQRLLDLAARLLGRPPGDWVLREDQAVARYTLWRRLFTGELPARIEVEVRLPGPLRPRSISDAVLKELASAPLPDTPSLEGLERDAARHSFPTWLAESLGRELTDSVSVMEALNVEPWLVLRSRPPNTRAARLAELEAADIQASAVLDTPDAIVLGERGTKVFETPPMKKGHLQVQDVGSQLIVELCRPPNGFAGASIADICAGAGGKALALADQVGPEGTLFASDLSASRLNEARRRARELGIRNIRFPRASSAGEADVTLVDAPCSGTGSLAREPDQKWKLTPEAIRRFAQRQRALLKETAEAIRPGTRLVYATCSLLRAENQDVVEAVAADRGDLEVEDAAAFVPAAARSGPFLQTRPGVFPGGGFFAARLRKRP